MSDDPMFRDEFIGHAIAHQMTDKRREERLAWLEFVVDELVNAMREIHPSFSLPPPPTGAA
jgi:hypothetical protein